MGQTACTRTHIFKEGFLGGKKTLIITSDFNTRLKPGQNTYGFHYGVDLRCAAGTSIKCPVPRAIITQYKTGGAGGQRLCIKYNNGKNDFYIWFMHLHTCNFNSTNIGQEVTSMEELGTSGGDPSDGKKLAGAYSTGPHLHLEIQHKSYGSTNSVDPKTYFLSKHILNIKTDTGAVTPYNGNGYEAGINAYYYNSADGTFCEEDCLTFLDVKNGSSGKKVQPKTESNNETEYERPKRKRKWEQAQERLALGIWQITKMVMDSSVQDRQIVDSSISVQTGSIQNFFNKVCQQPFVEFSGDTYGNQYYWMIRKPPFDREGFTRMLETAAVEIDDSDVISMQTQVESGSIYSWYQLIPTGDIMGVGEQMFMSPAVFFPEYAAIWGSKPLSVQSLYYNFVYSGLFNATNDDQRKENVNNIIRNVVADFKYLIESNAYRPFSKCGSVTLKGCRKIKRGTLASFSDGQVFHIDSVAHSYAVSNNSVSNTTTLQLSHGVYSKFIGEKWIDNFGDISYFNLIDWGDNFKIKDVTADNYIDKISQWKVNTKCMLFFLSKLHTGSTGTSLDEVTVNG